MGLSCSQVCLFLATVESHHSNTFPTSENKQSHNSDLIIAVHLTQRGAVGQTLSSLEAAAACEYMRSAVKSFLSLKTLVSQPNKSIETLQHFIYLFSLLNAVYFVSTQ